MTAAGSFSSKPSRSCRGDKEARWLNVFVRLACLDQQASDNGATPPSRIGVHWRSALIVGNLQPQCGSGLWNCCCALHFTATCSKRFSPGGCVKSEEHTGSRWLLVHASASVSVNMHVGEYFCNFNPQLRQSLRYFCRAGRAGVGGRGFGFHAAPPPFCLFPCPITTAATTAGPAFPWPISWPQPYPPPLFFFFTLYAFAAEWAKQAHSISWEETSPKTTQGKRARVARRGLRIEEERRAVRKRRNERRGKGGHMESGFCIHDILVGHKWGNGIKRAGGVGQRQGEGRGESRWSRGVDGFLICDCVREERQKQNKRERERGPVVKANRPPDRTHRGSLLTPIQEKGSKSEGREREGSLTHWKQKLRGGPKSKTAVILQDKIGRKEEESENEIKASVLRRWVSQAPLLSAALTPSPDDSLRPKMAGRQTGREGETERDPVSNCALSNSVREPS